VTDTSFDDTMVRRRRAQASIRNLVPLPAALVLLVLAGPFLSEEAANLYYRGLLVLSCTLLLGSAWMTARRFAPADRLFLGWLALGIGYGFAALRHGIRLGSVTTGGAMPSRAILDTMLVLQNLLVVAGLLLFIMAWKSTGLRSPFSRATELAAIAGGIAVALVAGGYPLLRGIATKQADSVLLVSTLGDIVALSLIVPLILPAFAMRGGLLMYTFLALGLSTASWLFYDIWLAAAPALELGPAPVRVVQELFRILAVALAFFATTVHRRLTM
jgi:hypothetical protein